MFIEGQLETRKWTDANGQEKYSTEVVLRNFKGEMTFLDSRGENNSSMSNNENVNNDMDDKVSNDKASNSLPESIEKIDSDIDDDIPF